MNTWIKSGFHKHLYDELKSPDNKLIGSVLYHERKQKFAAQDYTNRAVGYFATVEEARKRVENINN